MKKLLVLLIFLSFNWQANAQRFVGDWSGMLKVMGAELTINFHIKDAEGELMATMDSPDQGATGIPMDKAFLKKDTLYLEAAEGTIQFDGYLKSKDSISGTFRQNGFAIALPLHRLAEGKVETNQPQTPQPPFPYEIREVSFKNPKAGITLAGTLTSPENAQSAPAVILITGSGQQDRNETLFGHKPFWVIADYLTRNGIAVLRLDDRGIGGSTGAFDTSTTADFAQDIQFAFNFLEQQKGIDPNKIGLIGHSEGGLIAPMVAAQNPKVAFIVLLAGPGLKGSDLLVEQNTLIGAASGLDSNRLKQNEEFNKKIYALVESGAPDSVIMTHFRSLLLTEPSLSSLSPKEQETFLNQNMKGMLSPWMKYFLSANPADYLTKVSCPILALGGIKDLQVPPATNIPAIEKAVHEGKNPPLTTRVFPGLNHLFQPAETGMVMEYGKIEETFSPDALLFMKDWILKTED